MSVLAEITAAIASEFDIPDAGTLTVIVLRLMTAAVLGGMLGLERERKQRAAGFRTHILVSIGSALFVLAPLMAGVDTADVTRVMQGIVSGIGFLGAGAIIKMNGHRVEGVTTAAGIWLTAAIGMSAGMGMEILALVTTVVALLVLGVIPKLIRSDQTSES